MWLSFGKVNEPNLQSLEAWSLQYNTSRLPVDEGDSCFFLFPYQEGLQEPVVSISLGKLHWRLEPARGQIY